MRLAFAFTGKLDKITLTIERPKLTPEDEKSLRRGRHSPAGAYLGDPQKYQLARTQFAFPEPFSGRPGHSLNAISNHWSERAVDAWLERMQAQADRIAAPGRPPRHGGLEPARSFFPQKAKTERKRPAFIVESAGLHRRPHASN